MSTIRRWLSGRYDPPYVELWAIYEAWGEHPFPRLGSTCRPALRGAFRGGLSLRHLEEHLRTARILGTYEFPRRSSFPSYLLVLEGGLGVLAKPEDEHPDGPLIARREAAAWVIAREMGWSDLVSVTVLREVTSQRATGLVQASLQVLWPGAGTRPLTDFQDDDIWRAGAFDAVIRNTDRTGEANWLSVPDHVTDPMLKLPDHGYSLEPGLGPPSSAFYSVKAGEPLPTTVTDALNRLLAGLPASEIGILLATAAVDGVMDRTRALLQGGRLQFP